MRGRIRRAAEICPECGVRQRPPPSTAAGHLLDGRNPLLAALLSALFPGRGHIYARDPDTGLFFSVSFLLAVLSPFVVVGFVLVPAIRLYAIYDATEAAERRDRELSELAPAPET